jgi:hypothetical protein
MKRQRLLLLSAGLLLACGDPTEPIPTEPGYVLDVAIPGVTDRTFRGDSLYWRVLSGPDRAGGVIRQLILTFLVLDPPAPLLSPLELEMRWWRLEPTLPAAETYPFLGPPAGVSLQANSNVGTWGASQGQVILIDVSATRLRGTVTATLEQIYPPELYLPAVTLRGTFYAPHVPDGSVGAAHPAQ